ncbi:EamA family transporter [Bdellovibrio sp. HCB2-146]|uniref:EamA family transporter n=1 Tax=Bdellovibrio sp. HCB2-146 TaxID=3394362 RepID=UPI0039BCD547
MALGTSLLLLSAVLHAAWNALAKASKDKEAFLFLTIFISGLITFAMVFLVDGGFQMGSSTVVGIGILSGIFEGLYFITLGRALRESSLGQSYAIMRGGAMVFVWFISSFFLGETAKSYHYLGALIILGGIFVLNTPGKRKTEGARKISPFGNNKWSYWSAVFIAGYHLCYHQALVREAHPRSLFCIAMLVSLPFLFWSLGRKPFARIIGTWNVSKWRAILTGLGATASFLIFLFGLQHSAPGFAISLRNSSIFFALIFSFFLRESLTRVQIIGAITVGVGTFVLSI